MIGDGYWATGITVCWNEHLGWVASVDFYDDGFCEQGSTEGTLKTRYWSNDASEASLARQVDLVKADAERLGITFGRHADSVPCCLYYRGDGEDPAVAAAARLAGAARPAGRPARLARSAPGGNRRLRPRRDQQRGAGGLAMGYDEAAVLHMPDGTYAVIARDFSDRTLDRGGYKGVERWRVIALGMGERNAEVMVRAIHDERRRQPVSREG
jgi:hypothetical protein